MTIIHQTARLTIRQFNDDDAAFILRLLNEPSFLKNIGDKKVRTINDAKRYLNTGPLASYQAYGFGLCMVELTKAKEPIGMCGLIKRPELSLPDLGYAYLPKFWRMGYAKEAATAVLNNAKQQYNLTKIAAITSLENESSIHLLNALGFEQLRIVALYKKTPDSRYFEYYT
ncbi:GNAT family N-acetyltransferase [Thalassotalea piscium]|uniref:RimJ/RimL family protein N-acetyltransferase n=1 Tax=Thalassotalea piscium TaxID=1230533 RepID=A0A7X0TSZ8_9GAMM|nr:GNAT family N-acetyltransferase [Thalassotalea piscium]MBB6542624.1 RimJ/RimL family protein N-acetyltransferase [Thalassotalea piscium]